MPPWYPNTILIQPPERGCCSLNPRVPEHLVASLVAEADMVIPDAAGGGWQLRP